MKMLEQNVLSFVRKFKENGVELKVRTNQCRNISANSRFDALMQVQWIYMQVPQ